MIGTIANASTILVGSIIGSTLRKGFDEKYKNIMMDSMGLAATALGINSVVQAMPDSKYHVLFIVSLALGGIIGTALSLDTLFDRAVSKISKGSNLAQGLSTAILLYCAGTLSILGPIQSALQGDNTYLFTNAILDGITSIVLSSTFGIGIALAAIILAGCHLPAGGPYCSVHHRYADDGDQSGGRRADLCLRPGHPGHQEDQDPQPAAGSAHSARCRHHPVSFWDLKTPYYNISAITGSAFPRRCPFCVSHYPRLDITYLVFDRAVIICLDKKLSKCTNWMDLLCTTL